VPVEKTPTEDRQTYSSGSFLKTFSSQKHEEEEDEEAAAAGDHLTKSKHARKTRTWVLTRVVVTAVRPTPVQFPRDPE
jgi:hypothetical protein